MQTLYENILQILLMLGLLVCSAFFSGSETAFFSLSRRQIYLFRRSKTPPRQRLLHLSRQRLQHLAALLLENPRTLLGALLFANCLVNICFFSLATVLAVDLRHSLGRAAAALTAPLALALLILFGEMLPKSFAYTNSRKFSLAAALPVYFVVRILAPLHAVLNFLIVEPALRLTLGAAPPPQPVDSDRIKLLIESTKQKGLISDEETRLLASVVELGFLKVRHVMKPRVDMPACDINTPPRRARRIMTQNNRTKLPVYSGNIDNIIGQVYLRDILLRPAAALDRLLRDVNYVPEQKTVESLLLFFRDTGTDMAVVVDEYGQIAGSVTIENIAAELLGPIPPAPQPGRIHQLGPLKYRLPAALPVHEWAEAFGIEPGQTKLATIGGLVTALLGRIPRPGDTVNINNLNLTVEKMRKNRVKSVILTINQISDENPKP